MANRTYKKLHWPGEMGNAVCGKGLNRVDWTPHRKEFEESPHRCKDCKRGTKE